MSFQFDLNMFLSSSTAELEKLSWYDMISAMGLSSFNLNGLKPIQMIAELCEIQPTSKILMVGCGAGGTSIFISEHTQAEVWGIDITQGSIQKAQEAAQKSVQAHKLHFQIADAHQLPFESDSFDVIVTEFMAFFLKPEAFKEFFRVLKPSGRLALAELMLKDDITPWAEQQIIEMEQIYSDLVGFQFHIPKISHYQQICSEAGFINLQLPQAFPMPRSKDMIAVVGGWKNLFRIMKKIIKIMKESKILRKKFMMNGKVKKIMLRDKRTAKFICQGVMVAKKP